MNKAAGSGPFLEIFHRACYARPDRKSLKLFNHRLTFFSEFLYSALAWKNQLFPDPFLHRTESLGNMEYMADLDKLILMTLFRLHMVNICY